MKFAKNLVELAENFRKEFLSQTETDQEVTDSATATNETTGGPYICAHLRRQDYLRARPDEVPSMKEAALQLRHVFRKQSLNTVFVATDGTDQGWLVFSSVPNPLLHEGYLLFFRDKRTERSSRSWFQCSNIPACGRSSQKAQRRWCCNRRANYLQSCEVRFTIGVAEVPIVSVERNG